MKRYHAAAPELPVCGEGARPSTGNGHIIGRVMGSNLERLTALGNTQVKEFQYQLAIYIFNKGLENNKFSQATAVGLFQSAIGVMLVLLSDRIAKKLGDDGLL